MTRYYPYHLSCIGPIRRPTCPNRWSTRADEDFFTSRKEAVSWLRKDMLGCPIARAKGAGFIYEINNTNGGEPAPVKVKRIKFVKKVKPASRWKPTWIATRENIVCEEGRVDDGSWKSFETKKEALEYAERWASRPYWRPGTPKEVK